MTAGARLSIVLGTFNRLQLLKRCLDSVVRETRTPFTVHVTDAGSTDGTQDYLRSIESETIRPHLIGRKLGQAKAYNDVFRTLATPYVAWLSDDNEVVGAGLDLAVRILDRRPRVGMVALKTRDVQGPFLGSVYLGGVSEIGVLNVNQGVLRRETGNAVGWFSEAFGSYGIDPDLTAKVLYGGHDIVYTRPVALQHYRDWPTEEAAAEHAALAAVHERSLRLYAEKYAGFGEGDAFWRRKRRVWAWFKKRLRGRYDENSTRPVLGGLWRDWNNAFLARHISVLDPWLSLGQDWHLRQRARPRPVPPEPLGAESDGRVLPVANPR
jgi:glycosyltransferase involved in cell wall biosynthesis